MAGVITDEKLIEEVLTRGVERVFPSKDSLAAVLKSGRKLRIYLGADPTGPHLHFGHATNILTLKKLQKLGHEIIFLIGDFTARIGDPSGKTTARAPLTSAEVKANMKTFKNQVSKLLKLGLGGAKIKFNADWLSKMSFEDVVGLAGHFTVQQMMERDMFQERVREGKPVGLHEFLYPLMQGYDSVAMDVDIEVGGNDQTFNMMAGRTLAKDYLGKEKFVIATRLLVNPKTGKKLMNKSEGGMINLDDSARDIFGKVMAIADEAMFEFAELSTEMTLQHIGGLKSRKDRGENPRDLKLEIAEAATELLYGKEVAKKERENFLNLFSKHEISGELPVIKTPGKISALDFVLITGVADSKSEARRLITQGSLMVNEKKVEDPAAELFFHNGDTAKAGKKNYFRIEIK